MNTETITTPDGYMQNAQGHLVPVNSVKPLDLLRNDLVSDIISASHGLQDEMRVFKKRIMSDIGAFIALAAEQYDTALGGKKGNISLVTFDGKYKLMLAVSDTLVFDERLQVAKVLIDECIQEWTKGSDDKIKALIVHAFQVDKAGNISTSRVLGLFKPDIKDARWTKAMNALKDSITIASSKSYIRLYERVGDEGKYQQISMDMAGL